jgi:transposase InsO family protein
LPEAIWAIWEYVVLLGKNLVKRLATAGQDFSVGKIKRFFAKASFFRKLHDARRFVQPLRSHQHWHIDISYLNIAGAFYFLISVLDGYNRFVVHWDIRRNMKEEDVQIVVQRDRKLEAAREQRQAKRNAMHVSPVAVAALAPQDGIDLGGG